MRNGDKIFTFHCSICIMWFEDPHNQFALDTAFQTMTATATVNLKREIPVVVILSQLVDTNVMHSGSSSACYLASLKSKVLPARTTQRGIPCDALAHIDATHMLSLILLS